MIPSAKGFGSKLESQVGNETKSSGSKLGGVFSKTFVAASAAVGGAALLGGFLKDSIGEAREAQKVGAQTNAVIKATGGAAKISAKQVGDLATSISLKSGIDDEVIQSGENMLLTFKNIRNEAGKGNDIFNQSTKVLTDMSVAMGTEPKQAAIQLGKALNDPIKGISALSRVGVTFTDGQKKVITSLVESGKTADAQKIILKELNSEFGGSAAAQATAGEKMAVAWGNIQEQIGTLLLPAVDAIANAFVKITPAISAAIAGIGPMFGKIGAFIAPVVAKIQGLFAGGGAGGGLLTGIQSFTATVRANFLPVLQTMATTFTTKILPAVTAFASYVAAALLPIFRQVGSIIAGQVVPIVASFAQFLYGRLYPAVVQIVSAVASRLKPVFDQLVATFRSQVLPTLQKLLAKFREWQPTIQQVILVVVKIIGKVLEFAAAILGKVLPVVIRFAGFLLSKAVPAVVAVIEVIARIIGKVIEFGRTVVQRVQDVAKFVSGLKDKFGEAVNFVKGIPGKIKSALGDLGSLLLEAGKDMIRGFINGIKSMASEAAGAARDAAMGAVNAVKGALHIHSPSRVMHEIGRWTIEGMANGIKEASPKVLKAMDDAVKKLIDKATSLRDGIKSALDGVKSDFSSLRDSIASTFAGNLFDAQAVTQDLGDGLTQVVRSVSQSFVANLRDKRTQLHSLLSAFKKLKGWGIPSQFLSQLFASGNTDLILELAGGSKAQARSDAALFGQVQSLSNQLGTQVAQNQYGAQIKRLEDRLATANQHLKHLDNLAHDIGREINQAAAAAQRKKKQKAAAAK